MCISHRSRCLVTILPLLHLASGCASVKNFDAYDKDIGFEHFASKQYLLIEASKDGAQTMKVISLPDLSKPRYIKHKAGWGSAEFNFKIQNGILTEYGATHESKTADALTTLGTLGSAYGALLGAEIAAEATMDMTALSAMPIPGMTTQQSTAFNMIQWPVQMTVTIKSLVDIANDLKINAVDAIGGSNDPMLRSVSSAVSTARSALIAAANLAGADILAEVKTSQTAVSGTIKNLEKTESQLKLYLAGDTSAGTRALAIKVLTSLSENIRKLKSFAASGKQPVLYEILPRVNGGIEFRRVVLEP